MENYSMLPFPLLPFMLSEGKSMGFIIACLYHTLEIHLSLPHPGDYFAKSWSSVVCFFGGVPGRQYTLTDSICFACLGYLGEGQSHWSRDLTRKASGRGRAPPPRTFTFTECASLPKPHPGD